MTEIVIIDYKNGGNLFSVNNSLESIGASTQLSSDPKVIESASKIVFPGVGSFAKAITSLQELGIYDVLIKKIQEDTPVLAVCVGMQALFQSSTETASFGDIVKGMGIIAADVTKFDQKPGIKIPHMGWNSVHNHNPENPIFKGIAQDAHFYFVHSYRVDNQELTGYSKATTDYGEQFISHIWNGKNLFACQFHPEKSGEVGLQLLENFMRH
ncbi:MAG: imidazole glycerol phosphate synthase subunit HisH [Cyanobacteria bacterium]|nr:imidazole glycerol phosphate synthase subunit HisH [Cyanobacteriota bacterium]MDA1021428.1 imidazole glycerol phosphate synthase subunit HisH [Cyanobacteriota bacterium]